MNDPNLIRAVLQSPGAIFKEKKDGDGTPYLIRSGYVNAENDKTKKFYVAIGTSLEGSNKLLSQFTWQGVLLLPVVILTGVSIGWIFAGRALTPVVGIAQTAQRISGSNLSLRIPLRGAGDELDQADRNV